MMAVRQINLNKTLENYVLIIHYRWQICVLDRCVGIYIYIYIYIQVMHKWKGRNI